LLSIRQLHILPRGSFHVDAGKGQRYQNGLELLWRVYNKVRVLLSGS
jgi:hypothetical protein